MTEGGVLAAAWHAAGRPEPNWQGKAVHPRAAPPWRTGVCALTGVYGDVVDTRHVVSELFTGWDLLPHRGAAGAGFGRVAAWAFRHRTAMQRPHALIRGQWAELSPAGLLAALMTLPADAGFVTVPVSGQKHLLPWAAPGALITDHGRLPWTTADVDRLAMYREVRAAGFGEAAIAEPAPRWPILTRLPHAGQRTLLAVWPELDPWRRVPPYLDVAARATRVPKETV